jgi:hypothetical protein
MLKIFLLRRRLTSLLILNTLMAVWGCSDTPSEPTRISLAEQLWEARIVQRAITMSTVAPYDTITLRTIALNGLGDTITEGVQVRYHSVTDTTVRISDEGVLKVRQPTSASGIRIVASVTYNTMTRTDTAVVVVTTHSAPPSILDTIILETISPAFGTPVLPTWAIFPSALGNPTITARIMSNNGIVSNIPLDYVSSDPSVALVHRRTGEITPQVEGTATITAMTTWYGNTYQTTLNITVIGPMQGYFRIQERIPRGSDTAVIEINPGTIDVQSGAVISWYNLSSRPVSIIFDNPEGAHRLSGPYSELAEFFDIYCLAFGQWCNINGEGNISSISVLDPEGDPFGNQAMRYFPTPGTYRFRTESGATGTIEVK